MTQPGLRASDDDRRRVVSELERHTADGRLTLDEFAERVGRVYGAATHHDLAQITSDLPSATVAAAANNHRQLVIAWLLALITIIALGVVLAIFKP